MKLSYNVTGQERKSLVGAISSALNAPTKYLGAPTFAYEVGGYHIDKVGTLTGADSLDLEDALHQAGFDADGDTREYDEPGTYESGLGGMGALPTPEELEAEAYAEREMKRMAVEAQNVPDYSNRGQYGGDEIPDEGETDRLTVEFPLDGFSPETLDNLTKMVTAKEALIKAALGAEDLPVQMTADTVNFPWFTLSDPSEAAYYVQFIFALCKTAKEKKRITAKERGLADNPKYAMRCWLLSLGLIGDEYKNARKLLLSRLGGNSSFKGGSRPTYTAHLFTYPNGEVRGPREVADFVGKGGATERADTADLSAVELSEVRDDAPMDCETIEFTSLKAAKAKCDEFLADCESLKYAGCHVEGDDGTYLYEILTDGTVNER